MDFGTKTIGDKTWMQNEGITPFYLPTVVPHRDWTRAHRDHFASLVYSISPALPSGVTVAYTNGPTMLVVPEVGAGRVSGTPSVAKAQTEYTLTATDADGDKATISFNITVNPDNSPRFADLVEDKRWIRGAAITGFTLPTASGGNGALT